ncbi:MAG: DUF262 domain-containing protein [Candidatus Caldarchaeum sp.]|uniref:DUF262 domain-containing protein n=1 Tax=Caldiarchaeum subterraneum TaxID=311458 RepID=A0A7C4E2F9_CALS0
MDFLLGDLMPKLEQGEYIVPDIQRPFVWRNNQILELADSIYNRFPIGSICVAEIPPQVRDELESIFRPIADDMSMKNGRYILIDGRQRLTSLLLIKHGEIKINNEVKRINLLFDALNEKFVLGRGKARPSSYTYSVAEVLQVNDLSEISESYQKLPEQTPKITQNLMRLWTNFYHYRVTFMEVSVNWNVIDHLEPFERISRMFVALNRQGTKVKLHDLVLALLSGKIIREQGRRFRDQFEDLLNRLQNRGYDVDAPPLIRAYLAISTGQIKFKQALAELEKHNAETLLGYLNSTSEAFQRVLDIFQEYGARPKFLVSHYLPVMPAIIMHNRYLTPKKQVDKKFKHELLRWLVLASFEGRYTGRLESDLLEDLESVKDGWDIKRLIENLKVKELLPDYLEQEFSNEHRTLLSILLKFSNARDLVHRDWSTNDNLKTSKIWELGDENINEHHIFPQYLFKKKLLDPELENDAANITFLSQHTNKALRDKEPSDYLPKLYEEDASMLEEHCIPLESELWKRENYGEFLKERRKIILDRWNKFLASI